MTSPLPFVKGHGTQNDFILIPDAPGRLDLSAERVATLSDRRAGLGADGVIRVVRTDAAQDESVRAQSGSAAWFMDYRNADGSLAQMCGNGARVFAAYLREAGLESGDEFDIATRAGVKHVRIEAGRVAVSMGRWSFVHPDTAEADGFDSLVHLDSGDPYSALSIDLGNPHTVVALPERISLSEVDLTREPEVRPAPVDGTNVEVVRPMGPGHLAMRVYERGVGETRSCGTGACAAAIAMSFWAGALDDHTDWSVEVPGGQLTVRMLPGQEVELEGPAALVASGEVRL